MRVILKKQYGRHGIKASEAHVVGTALGKPEDGSYLRIITNRTDGTSLEIGPVLFILWERSDTAYFYTPEGVYDLKVVEDKRVRRSV